MKIEAGKYYKTRDGRKVGPTIENDFPNSYYPFKTSGGLYVMADGTANNGWNFDSKSDLVAEWSEGPVRTVTRKEIVPGTYGRVAVGQPYGSTVPVSVGSSILAPWAQGLTPAELRAAAATFVELADALEAVEA